MRRIRVLISPDAENSRPKINVADVCRMAIVVTKQWSTAMVASGRRLRSARAAPGKQFSGSGERAWEDQHGARAQDGSGHLRI